jgi:hypothetical protein
MVASSARAPAGRRRLRARAASERPRRGRDFIGR